MNVNASLTKETSDAIAGVQHAFAAALASIPAPPAGVNLLTTTIGGNLFEGNVSIPIAPSPELKAWAQTVTAKLNAFASAK